MKLASLLFGLALMAVAVDRAGAAAAPKPMDFSRAGCGGGGVALPLVPAKFAVAPSGGDDTRLIQAALDAAGKLALDANGIRGAVVLRPGTYRTGGPLRLNASGVGLRGDGGTLLAAGNSRRTLIEIRGDSRSRPISNSNFEERRRYFAFATSTA